MNKEILFDVIATVGLSCGLFTMVDGIGKVYIYITSACHGEGVDFNSYFLPGLVRIVIGGLIIAVCIVLCIQGSSL